VAAAQWQLYFNENGKNVNGVIPPYWMAPHLDRENVVVEGTPTHTNPATIAKKHIAFHLVSNVLDDEVPDDSHVKDTMLNSLQNNMYGSMMNDQSVDSWQTPSSNFSLPLATDKNTDNKRSINNKSIHEIWSPDPSNTRCMICPAIEQF
jgi:hypothetical protein